MQTSRVVAATMSESARTDSSRVGMRFNNFQLKRWLHRMGPVRRYTLLQKLKADLQNLGLSQRQVRQGLLQLATKPRVVLMRLPNTGKRHGVRQLSQKNYEEKSEDSIVRYRSKTACVEQCTRKKYKVSKKFDSPKNDTEEETEQSERTTRLKADRAVNYSQGSHSPNRNYKLENKAPMTLHSFDKALAYLDVVLTSKTNMPEKSIGKRTTVIVSADTTYKSQDQNFTSDKSALAKKKCIKDDDTVEARSSIPNLMDDKTSGDFNQTRVRETKSRLKLNFNFHGRKSADSDKFRVNKKINGKENSANTDLVSNKIKCYEEHVIGKESMSPKDATDIDAILSEESTRKRSQGTVVAECVPKRKKISSYMDEILEINKQKRKKVKNKFRMYFGDCISVSEDEQEQDILLKRYNRKRKKKSAESCDFEVRIEDSASSVQILKDIQQAVPDSTVQEVNEDSHPEVPGKSVIIDEPKAVVNNESIELVNEIQCTVSVAEDEDDKVKSNCKVASSRTDTIETVQKQVVRVNEDEVVSDTLEDALIIAESPQPEADETMEKKESKIDNEKNENYKSKHTNEISSETLDEINNSEDSDVIAEKGVEGNINRIPCDRSEECNNNYNIPIVGTNVFTESPENKLSTTHNNEHFQINLDDNYEIVFDENVLQASEECVEKDRNQNIVSKITDVSTNLRVLSETLSNYNEIVNDKGATSNNSDNNVNVNAIVESNENEENAGINSVNYDTCVPTNQVALQEPELNNNTEKEDVQSSNIPQTRLRVLSSAELGSRWCPTPISTSVPIIDQSLQESTTLNVASGTTVSNAVNPPKETVPVVSTPVSTSTPTEVSANVAKGIRNDRSYERNIHSILLNISTIVQKMRRSPNLNFEYDKLLFAAFEKLGGLLKTDNYVSITNNVVRILNREILVNQPLSPRELLHHSPSVKSLYFSSAKKYIIAQSNLNKGQYVTTAAPSKTTMSACTYQISHQNISATSKQTKSPRVSLLPKQQSYTPNINQVRATALFKELQQTVKERVQSNSFQSNATVPSSANCNVRQIIHNTNRLQPPFQRRASQTYFSGTELNYSAAHDFSGYALNSSLNSYPPGRPAPVPIMNSSLTNAVPPNIYTAKDKTIYNTTVNTMSALNNSRQQSINSINIQNSQNTPAAPTAQQFHHLMYGPAYVPGRMMHAPATVPLLSQDIQQSAAELAQTMKQSIPQVFQNAKQNVQTNVRMPQNGTQSVIQVHQNIQQNVPQISSNIQQQIVPQLFPNGQQHVPQLSQNIQQQNIPQLAQTVQQNIQLQNYIPVSVQKMFVTNTNQLITRNTQDNGQIYQKTAQQARMTAPVGFTPVQTAVPQYTPNIQPPRIKQPVTVSEKKMDDLQVSLESTVNQFDVLKYLTTIQKIMLHRQMSFYFGCTTWLQKQFTSEQWQMINSERSRLLHFHTLMKHLVEKILDGFLHSKCQEGTTEKDILKDIKIGKPQKIQIIVQEDQEVHDQNNTPKSPQHAALNADQPRIIRQENLDVLIISNEADSEQNVTDNLQSLNQTSESSTIQEAQTEQQHTIQQCEHQSKDLQNLGSSETLEILQEEIRETDAKSKETPHQDEEDSVELVPNLEGENILKNNANETEIMTGELGGLTNLPNSNVDNLNTTLAKADENTSCVEEAELLTLPDLEKLDKDVLQRLSPHLVTVEIHPNSDYVTVIDIIKDAKDNAEETINKESIECEEQMEDENISSANTLSQPYTDSSSVETLTIHSPVTSNNSTDSLNDIETDCVSDESVLTHIADVRSITLEAFERMEEGNKNPTNTTEGRVEEEEIKVCLFCSKPCTVVCSICLEAKYCSKLCSELHWEEHYQHCEPAEQTVYMYN